MAANLRKDFCLNPRSAMQMKLKILTALTSLALVGMLSAGDDSLRNYLATRNLALDEAVHIALDQNPDIQKALQEIQRTRGVVLEVSAEALPHITATGVYNQQDKKLTKDFGGAGGAGAQASPSPATTGTATTATAATTTAQAPVVASAFGIQDKSWQVLITG